MNKIERGWREIARVVGDTINQKRRELGWSVEKLSKAAKISPAVIYATEAGDKLPRVENIDSMLKALGAVVVLGGFNEPKVKEKKIYFAPVKDAPEDTVLPKRATDGSAGYDCFSPKSFDIEPHSMSELIHINVKAIMPKGWFFQLFIRSGMAVKHGILLCTSGTIDADFANNPTNDGNIGVKFINMSDKPYHVEKGDRICQGIFLQHGVTDDDEPMKGTRKGDYGSTGV